MNNTLEKTYSKLVSNNRQYFDYLITLIFSVFSIFAILYQIKLLNYIEWGDESETIVAAKMIAAGYSLYSQIFNHHGPLTFLPGVLLEKIGTFGVAGHRVFIATLQVAALVSIYFSPLLKNNFIRKLYVITAASVMLLYFPDIFGHTYMYQVLAGILLVIILTQYSLPIIFYKNELPFWKVILGNILIACLPFLAITYAPICFLLLIASLRKDLISKSIVVFLGGIAVNITFLICIGSIAGYFAFHIYLNSTILPIYNGGQSGWQLIQSAFNALTSDLAQFTIFSILMAAIIQLANKEKTVPWRSILLCLGIVSLLMRGAGFQGLPYFYSLLAIPLVFFTQSAVSPQFQFIGTIFSLACITKVSLLIPGDIQKINVKKLPESTEFSQLVQSITNKNDRIIAYSFNNYEYIAADRLPASGYFFYLPWQEKYNEHPKFGISINACQEISKYRPKIMLINKWTVWDRFPWDSYASCVQRFIDNEYTQLPGRPFYIRKDIYDDAGFPTPADNQLKMQPSSPLNTMSPIKILMTQKSQYKNAGLKRIGIQFGTYMRKNTGDAELKLRGSDGSKFTQHFTLSDLSDNQYRYFDLDSKHYITGEIISTSGNGISTWESHDEKGNAHTCLIYEYTDGKKQFTPGCPIF